MNRIIVSDAFITQIGTAAQPLELYDSQGHILGHFVPISVSPQPEECPYSEAELKQMHSEEGGRSLSEIWEALGAK